MSRKRNRVSSILPRLRKSKIGVVSFPASSMSRSASVLTSISMEGIGRWPDDVGAVLAFSHFFKTIARVLTVRDFDRILRYVVYALTIQARSLGSQRAAGTGAAGCPSCRISSRCSAHVSCWAETFPHDGLTPFDGG